MKYDTISTLCRWFRCTEADMFKVAYLEKYGEPVIVLTSEEFSDFIDNQDIPKFLHNYIKETIYPQLLVKGGKYEDDTQVSLLQVPDRFAW